MHSLKPKQKRKARIIALKIIYAYEFKGSNIDDTIKFILSINYNLEKKIFLYSRHLSNLIMKNLKKVDELIKSKSKNWDFNRIAIIDKLILRMSLVEMLFEDSVPPKVSITEGVEIAKKFSTADSSSFINGILDSIYNDFIKNKEKLVK